MTPKHRDRFFSSLLQLERRLASESSPSKKVRLEDCKGFAGTESRLANSARSATKCGVLVTQTTIADNDETVGADRASKCGFAVTQTATAENDETVGADDIGSASANPDSKDDLARANDASLAALNATLGCVLADTDACNTAHLSDLSNSDAARASLRCGSNAMESAGIESVEAHAGHYLGAGITDTVAVDNNDFPAGTKSIRRRLNTSSGDCVHVMNVDFFSHGRESSDSVTLCKEEEEIFDAIFSGDNNEDSGSLLEFSARWSPWEIGRHTCESSSHPPAEFLSIPMTNDIREAVDGKTPELLTVKSLRQDLHEQDEDDLQDLTHLCALLGLNEHAWLAEGKEASPAGQTNKFFDESRLDSDALYCEHPSSTFYSKIAKVCGGENVSECAKALDFWLQRLGQSQTEPYCCALLLLAKASLQKKMDIAEGFYGKFPSIVQEWLALQHVDNKQKLM